MAEKSYTPNNYLSKKVYFSYYIMSLFIERNNGVIEIEFPSIHLHLQIYRPTDRCYIGRTKDIERRITQHMSGRGSPALLQDLVDYGRNAFSITILETLCSNDEATHDAGRLLHTQIQRREWRIYSSLQCPHRP